MNALRKRWPPSLAHYRDLRYQTRTAVAPGVDSTLVAMRRPVNSVIHADGDDGGRTAASGESTFRNGGEGTHARRSRGVTRGGRGLGVLGVRSELDGPLAYRATSSS